MKDLLTIPSIFKISQEERKKGWDEWLAKGGFGGKRLPPAKPVLDVPIPVKRVKRAKGRPMKRKVKR